MPSFKTSDGSPFPILGERLVVGHCDVSGAGVRACLGLKPGDFDREGAWSRVAVELTGVPPRRRAIAGEGVGESDDGGGEDDDDDDDDAPRGVVFTPGGARVADAADADAADAASAAPMTLTTFDDGVASVLAVNEIVRPGEEAAFAAAVHDLLTDDATRGNCEGVVVVAALRMNAPKEGRIFQNVVNGAAPLLIDFQPAELPPETKINDPVVAALAHAMTAGGHEMHLITTHGYRVAKLGTKDEKEASECANRVGGAVAAALECRFRKTGLEATRVWTTDAAAPKEKTDHMYT
jgi:hypothetical protein